MPSKKNKIKNAYTVSKMYDSYLAQNPEGTYDYVDKKMYVRIVEDYCKHLADSIVDGGEIVKLPYNKGPIGIFKWLSKSTKLSKAPVDWVKSKELGKKVYLTNAHSNGYVYKFFWDKGLRQKTLLSFYKFKACRALTRRLAEVIKTKQNDYYLRPN